ARAVADRGLRRDTLGGDGRRRSWYAPPVPLRRTATWLFFPVLLVSTLTLAAVLMPRIGPALAVAVSQTLTIVALHAAERLLPFRREWVRAHGDVQTDVLHAFVSGIG